MPATPLPIRRELARQGIEFQGRLRVLKTGRVVSDGTSLVVKVMSSRLTAENYVADLEAYARAGVPAEQLVADEPLVVADKWAVVVRFLAPVEPTQAKHSMAVGKLLRRTHDLVWPFDELRQDDEVYCPDDWRPENIVVTAGGPVMVDLDLAKAQPRTRAVDLAIHDFGKPFGHDPRIGDEFMTGYLDRS